VADYLDGLDAARAAAITGRLRILERLRFTDELPFPPFANIPGSDLFALLVDYDREVHKVVFGAWIDDWLLVHAFLDPGHPASDREYSVARQRWLLLSRGF
jgi:hypothetical protein